MNVTPSHNQSLAHRHAAFSTLAEGLDYAARGETGFNFYSGRGHLEQVVSYRDLRQQAIDRARRLVGIGLPGIGLKRGDRVALVAETTPEFVAAFFACQYAGFVPVPLPLCINFGGVDAYRERLKGMIKAADARLAVASAGAMASLEAATDDLDQTRVLSHDQWMELPLTTDDIQPLGPDDSCYIQYSSGSTSFPRGVVVTQKALVANARSIGRDGLQLVPGDRCCSWLPLYHDMGLVGCCLTPILNQVSVDYMATSTFAKRPLLWLEMISRNRATISFGPTFGYELCARRAAKAIPDGIDLSTWRVAGIGGEMIRPAALRGFADLFKSAGFDSKAFLPSYGMAEATLAVTFTKLDEDITSDRILRRDAYENGRAIVADETDSSLAMPTREFAHCGRPMPGYEIAIVGDDGTRLGERQIGRIFIKGPSLMNGYFREPDLSSRVLSEDGWLNSGDLGYMIDGSLVVTGRSKDLIIVGGRNIWPQDLEWSVETLDDVRAGDSAAFSIIDRFDQEQAVIVVQCRKPDPQIRSAMRDQIRSLIQRVAGIDCKVVLAGPRSLTFTTSGKLSRAAVKSAFEHGGIVDLDDEKLHEERPNSTLKKAA